MTSDIQTCSSADRKDEVGGTVFLQGPYTCSHVVEQVTGGICKNIWRISRLTLSLRSRRPTFHLDFSALDCQLIRQISGEASDEKRNLLINRDKVAPLIRIARRDRIKPASLTVALHRAPTTAPSLPAAPFQSHRQHQQ
jgi:hypothetical protein